VGSVVIDQLRIRFSTFGRYQRKNGCNGLVIHVKKAYDSVKREVFYNILLKFGIHKKLIRLIKLCLNEA
jgi:hypothetical protein